MRDSILTLPRLGRHYDSDWTGPIQSTSPYETYRLDSDLLFPVVVGVSPPGAFDDGQAIVHWERLHIYRLAAGREIQDDRFREFVVKSMRRQVAEAVAEKWTIPVVVSQEPW